MGVIGPDGPMVIPRDGVLDLHTFAPCEALIAQDARVGGERRQCSFPGVQTAERIPRVRMVSGGYPGPGLGR